MTDPSDKLTTDPPLPPGTPDVDELVGESAPSADQGPRSEPAEEDVASGPAGAEPEDEDVASDPVSVEPPD